MLNIAHSKRFCIRATRALVHSAQLLANLAFLRSQLNPGVGICAAVKADAYGHGAVLVSQVLVKAGIERLAVATLEEGLELRQAGIEVPILLYGALQDSEWPEAAEANLEPFVSSHHQVEVLGASARVKGKVVRVHLKVDTGMGRLGCAPDDAVDLAHSIVHSPWLELEGISTHFASSEAPGPVSVSRQFELFQQTLLELADRGFAGRFVHAANSGAVLGHAATHFNLVRPGISLYGYAPAGQPLPAGLKPILKLVSQVAYLKTVPPGTPLSYGSKYVTSQTTDVATIPIGYADGYRRSLSNVAPVVIGGKTHHVSGTVCMDQILVDVGPDSGVKVGDEVVLLGGDAGAPTADDLARLAGTISYEVLCGLSRRIPRLLVD